MKSIRDIVIIAAVAIGLLALVVFLFRPGKAATKDKNSGDATGDDPPVGPLPCQNIPGNLPPFQNAVTPSGAKAFLGVPDADWTPEFEARLRGFFMAMDVEPTEYTMKYFGSKLIWQYLNSQDGQLPDMVVLKGSKRCDTIVGVPANDIPKPPFCLNFTVSGHWLSPAYDGGKNVGSDTIREEIGINKSDWVPAVQARVKSFFKAINLEPSEQNARALCRYMGRNLVKEYLNSPFGGLPDAMVTKGVMRCDGKGNNDKFINDL